MIRHNASYIQLNLGCENKILPGFINLDVVAYPGVSIRYDLNNIPYPLESNIVDYMLLSHVLSFLDNPMEVMKELHRICKPGGIIEIYANHYSHFTNFTDLKQKVSFSYFSLGEHWTNKELYNLFKVVKKSLNFNRSNHKWMNKLFNPVINSMPLFYERFLSGIIPCSEVYFKLEVIKPYLSKHLYISDGEYI